MNAELGTASLGKVNVIELTSEDKSMWGAGAGGYKACTSSLLLCQSLVLALDGQSGARIAHKVLQKQSMALPPLSCDYVASRDPGFSMLCSMRRAAR